MVKRRVITPIHLSESARKIYKSIVENYKLEERHLAVLTKALEAYDRADQAKQILDEQGLTFINRAGNPQPRPEVAIERDSRLAFARLLKDLGLDYE